MATELTFALDDVKTLMHSQPEKLDIHPVAYPVIGHDPDVIAESHATEVVDEVMAFETQAQVEVTNEGNQTEHHQGSLVLGSVLEEQLRCQSDHWIEIVVIAATILNCQRVKSWEVPQVTTFRLAHLE